MSSLAIGGREFEWGRRTYIMGVINVTPDSFSGDGLGDDVDAAVAQGVRFVAEGADMLDVGGASSRPGFEETPEALEMARVLPVIERLSGEANVPISIDSTRATVARAAIAAGASVVNDIMGLRGDPAMAAAVHDTGAACVLMHNQRGRVFHDVVADITGGWRESVHLADEAGVPRTRIILDPGFGFGWSEAQNLEMLRRLPELRAFGYPLLIGTSRKSTLGAVAGGLAEDDRLEATAASVAIAIAFGVDIVRVHDVRQMARVSRVADAIIGRPAASATTMATVYLGLGSNLGDRLANLKRGLQLLPPQVVVEQASALYETVPWGVVNQPKFLNAAVLARTALPPSALLEHLKEIESQAGRRPGRRWGARLLDIDLLYYDELLLTEADLQIPHPRIPERAFVLAPMADLAPTLGDPRTGRTIEEMLAATANSGLHRLSGPEWAAGVLGR